MSRTVEMLQKFLFDPQVRMGYLTELGVYDRMSDEEFLKMKFKHLMGKELDLENPQTFNEKLQWLKLYNRKPEYTMMVDKYKVRQYIKEKLGEEYLIPLLGAWDDPDEINFETLPEQFVLKCNHNSGLGMCICKDKSKLDVQKVREGLHQGLKENYFRKNREWPYKNVPRKVIAEKYMTDESGVELKDYKVLCFNGEPKLIELHRGRFENHYQDFYDVNCKKTEIEQPCDPVSDITIEKPVFWDEMMEKSRILAEGLPHVRVDWYFSEGHLYFGELTFFDGSGFCAFKGNWDQTLGQWITLPEKTCAE